HVVLPSQVTVNQPFAAGVRVVDSFGNPSRFFTGEITLTGPAGEFEERSVHFTPEDGGARWVDDLRLTTEGVHHLHARAGTLESLSNPCQVRPADTTLPSRYWGDLHGQTGQTVGTGSLDEYFT